MSVCAHRAVGLVALSLCLSTSVRSQLIQVKTVPLAQGNQFQIFPSANLGMGSIAIALPDSVDRKSVV